MKGKLPGGIDLIIRALVTQQRGYVHDLLLEWFEEYQSTTINVRLFGIDKVGPPLENGTITDDNSQYFSMDSEHLKFLLVTGHTNFSRGDTQKELLRVYPIFFPEDVVDRPE